ncbi:MAG: sulfur oxidation c-type cytochrome SoxX [Hyphomicrobiales bacterium]|nr:sulfur oxidation c-type cytochrome SoxX [Hyphomicrobiales bacterium]
MLPLPKTISLLKAAVLCLAALAPATSAAQNICKKKTNGYAQLVMTGFSAAKLGGIDTPLTSALGDPGRGLRIVAAADKGACAACHQIPQAPSERQGDMGPSLQGVGARYTEAQLRQWIVDPGAVAMPAYHKQSGLARVAGAYAGKTILTAQEVEDVVAFLKTLR